MLHGGMDSRVRFLWKYESMFSSFPGRLPRRALLVSMALVPLAGCDTANESAQVPQSASGTSDRDTEFAGLEKKYDARLGVFAVDSRTNATVSYRADERYAYCSIYKALAAAAVLSQRTVHELDEVVHYAREDLVTYSPVTEKHVEQGMTVRALCEAAVRHSDNTAGNLLFQELGGPQGLNGKLRGLGDDVTQMDRVEGALNSAVPGELFDTSTPRALANDLRHYALGTGLSAEKKLILNDWLEGNATGANLIRAGVPQEWKVGDKSGAGAYGTRNDIGIIHPLAENPICIAVLSTRTTPEATYDDKLIAEASRIAVQHLT